jgi:hypothetical protein
VIHTRLACQLTVGKAMSEGLNESTRNFDVLFNVLGSNSRQPAAG